MRKPGTITRLTLRLLWFIVREVWSSIMRHNNRMEPDFGELALPSAAQLCVMWQSETKCYLGLCVCS